MLRVINSYPGDPQPIFQAVLKNAVRLCDAEFGNIYHWDGDALRLVATRNAPPAFAEARRLSPSHPSSKTPTGRMIAEKKVVHTADLRAEQAYADRDPWIASKLAAYLDTPRTSVLRKLAQLKREGFVEQRGHTCVLHDHLLNSVGIEDTRAAIRMIRSLAEQLIQFDNEGVQNGHENRPQNRQPAHIKAA